VGLAQGSARLVDSVLLSGEHCLSSVAAPSITAGATSLIQHLASPPGLGLTTGAVAGLTLASGALWGETPLSLDHEPLWKRILLKPSVNLYNDGIGFRHRMERARSAETFGQAFSEGAKAGFQVGSTVGGSAGRIQGALSGGMIGWRLSGEALGWTQRLLETAPLPPLAQSLLPLAVATTCVVAGQALGSTVGGVLGQVAGGSVVGVGCGLSASLSRR